MYYCYTTLGAIMRDHLDLAKARLIIDGNKAYKHIKNHVRHDVIDHEVTYVSDDIHTQGIENYWSLLKRGLFGIFYHVDREYLPQYLHEFQYRYNQRHVTDSERFEALFSQIQGWLCWYFQPSQVEEL